MHWKKRTTRPPGETADKVSGGREGRGDTNGRTVENTADDCSGEGGLFPKVQIVWDLRSIRIIGPGRVGHGSSGVQKERKGR